MNDNAFPEKSSVEAGGPSVRAAATDLRSAAGDFAKNTGAQAAKVKEKTVEAAHTLSATAKEKAGQYKAVASEKADHYRAVAADKATQAKENAQQQYENSRVRAKEIHVTVEDYIRQNPTKAVLGALGVGFLIGLITRK